MNAFLVATSFLTRIPVNITGDVDDKSLSRSIIFFPVVGAIIGAINALVYFALVSFLPMSVISVILIALPIIITGGLHFDGLMDTCDGLFSGRPREQILEIMRDSRVGSMGVIAGILNILLRFSILTELPGAILPAVLFTAAVSSRWVMSLALHFFPYARQEGKGAGFNAQKSLINIIVSTLFAGGIIFLTNRGTGLLIMLLAAFICLILAFRIAKKLGGLTGDVYGALNEVTENIFLSLWMALISSSL